MDYYPTKKPITLVNSSILVNFLLLLLVIAELKRIKFSVSDRKVLIICYVHRVKHSLRAFGLVLHCITVFKRKHQNIFSTAQAGKKYYKIAQGKNRGYHRLNIYVILVMLHV